MMIKQLSLVFSTAIKHRHFELLHVSQRLRIAREWWKVLGYASRDDFLGQQIGLVKKQDDGDAGKCFVVADQFENVGRLHETIVSRFVREKLVEFVRRDKKQDGTHVVEALVPHSPLSTMAADVNKQERNVSNDEIVFRYTFWWFARVYDVLQRRYVVLKIKNKQTNTAAQATNTALLLPIQ